MEGQDHTSLLRRLAALSDPRFFAALLLPIAVIYLATTSWDLPSNIDTTTNVFTAAALAEGSPVVERYDAPVERAGDVTWLVQVQKGWISPYPPGAALMAAPFYVGQSESWTPHLLNLGIPEIDAAGPVPITLPPIWPGSVAAAIASAAAMALLGTSLRHLEGTATAVAAAGVAAFGTSAWSVAADALWQHGHAMFWLSVALYAIVRTRWWIAGAAFGAAICTRQLTAVIALVVGLGLFAALRSWRPLVGVGVPSTIGALAIASWYLVWFDRFNPAGARNLVGALAGAGGGGPGDLGTNTSWLGNVASGLFNPLQGILVISPFFLIALFFLRGAWGEASPVSRVFAVAGVGYLAVQYQIQIFGTYGYLGYRYPLEGLFATAPLIAIALRRAWRWSPLVTGTAIGLGALVHTLFAVVG